MELRKIIVVTPVKNEAWILEAFLRVTSAFADAIIIADQQSDDNTIQIVNAFPKAILLENPSQAYNNATRQKFLLEEARIRFPGNPVILALDADEIAAADSQNPVYWNHLRSLSPGTLLYFRKTDLVQNGQQSFDIPYTYYPLGFIDDGVLQHSGKPMHSVRIPLGLTGQLRVDVQDIHFLHLQRLRPKTQEAKRRFYQVKERDFGMNPWYWRRKRYNKKNFLGLNIPLKSTPAAWLAYPAGWEVDISSLREADVNWFDEEVYTTLQKIGGYRYWIDDIWDIDWNTFREEGKHIALQPRWLKKVLMFSDYIFNILYILKQKFGQQKSVI